MVTFDVTNLYSNSEKKAISFWKENTLKHSSQDLTEKIITYGIVRILINNSLQFNNKNYISNLRTKITSQTLEQKLHLKP